ncbi:hypothetical protein PVAP13_5KG122887 [Panicum virgatum]|uniref:Uncharacterized protein n=1 Tax=Panicum virgatum TaxID=38727 RepID=A0A8T0SCH8_PANVG|nr:hypothetical protein PVAP13_5KG122887 [Panicum virgatum]
MGKLEPGDAGGRTEDDEDGQSHSSPPSVHPLCH